MVKPPEERFWGHVARRDCWEWKGATLHNGYGSFSHHHGYNVRAHRFSYEMHFGPIPKGFQVCHKCDNRRCVHPDHLFLGTNEDNRKDSVEKNRHEHGERHWNSKLTVDDIRQIRSLANAGNTHTSIANQFHIRVWTVSRIVRRIAWKSV